MFIAPAHKNNTQVSRGRGKGGLATLWDKSLTKYVSKVSTVNFRLQATKFSFPCGSFLLLNTYFPCDPRLINFDETELLTLLEEIRQVLIQEKCTYNLVLGDLNSHFHRQSTFTSLVDNFFIDLDFKIFWENPDEEHNIHRIDFTYSQTQNGQTSSSVIDHFASNGILFNSVMEAGVIHTGENPSNHSPIYTRLQLSGIDPSTEKPASQKRVNWDKASDQAKIKYQETLADRLGKVIVPTCIQCTDVHCIAHTEELEEYTMDILEAVECSAAECLPSTGGGNGKSLIIPGWSEYVKPFCDESKFWYSVWLSAGQPQEGSLFSVMRDSKLQYKYAVRRLKRANQKIQNDKFLQGVVNGGTNIFKEIKKFRGTSMNCSSRIDGEVGSKNIANKFADIYSQLYNTHEHGPELEQLSMNVNAGVLENSVIHAERITADLVRRALGSMKSAKSDAIFNFQSDCLINGPDALVTHLTNMIRACVIHGNVPYFILVCTLLPLVKDNLADITSSDNYRAIASGSLILKLLDIIIIMLEGDKLGCDQLQFGFQAGASTSMCTWAATSVIEHYNRQGSVVYGCAMDLSKAFDLVEWVELFTTLVKKNMSPIFLRLLLFIYKNQFCDVKWSSSYSHRFSVSNGVRQGAVSSPLLFSVYIDGLIVKLRGSGLGCRVDHCFFGCLGYADDLLLLSASRSGLQAMVTICEKFAKMKHLKFSTNVDPIKSKTKCLIFSPRIKDRSGVSPILLNGDPLPWVREVKHLGNILQCENNMKRDIAVKRGKFIGKVNSMLQELHFADPIVFVKLLKVYCTSFYGSNLWNIYSDDVDRLYKSWNVTIRNVFNIPNTTHRYLIEPVSGCPHPKTMLTSRFVKFTQSLGSCSKQSIRYLVSLVKNDNRTLMGKTLSRISRETQVAKVDLTSSIVSKTLLYFPVPTDQLWRVKVLLELLDVRNGSLSIDDFNKKELNTIIDYLCTT